MGVVGLDQSNVPMNDVRVDLREYQKVNLSHSRNIQRPWKAYQDHASNPVMVHRHIINP